MNKVLVIEKEDTSSKIHKIRGVQVMQSAE